MRAVLVLSLLGACGRLGFDDRPAADATDAPLDPYTTVVLADNPRVLYRLDEASGPLARDSTGQHDAVYYTVDGGALTFGQPGALRREANPGVLFQGDGNSGPNITASVEQLPIDVFQGDFTIEVFFRPTATFPVGYSGALIVCEDYLDSGFRTGIRPDLTPALWADQGGATSDIFGATPLVLGTWAYLVFIKRGANGEVWLDGVQQASEALDMIPPSLTSAMTECGFGAFHGMPSYGVFDEVAAYDRALSASEIAAHFAAH